MCPLNCQLGSIVPSYHGLGCEVEQVFGVIFHGKEDCLCRVVLLNASRVLREIDTHSFIQKNLMMSMMYQAQC